MIQDKFIDSYIQDIFDIGHEASNVFWLRGNKGDSPHVNTLRKVEYIGVDKNHIRVRLKQLKPEDNIFIHWYDMWIAELVIDLPNKLFAIYWGGDFFGDPITFHMNWLYEKETLKVVKQKLGLKLIFRKNLFEMYKQWKKVTDYYSNSKIQYGIKHKQISRIDYIILAEENNADVNKTKQLYPGFKAKHLPGFYDLNFDLANNINLSPHKTGKKIKILFGNSATPANNHLDAFKTLSKMPDIEIYCPLSYGDKEYGNLVVEEGIKLFGDSFIPVTNFMSREDYVNFLNEMDIIFMFHNRSQAFGNIITAMSLGKPVFLRKSNSLKQMFNVLGITNYDADLIDKINLHEAIETSELTKAVNVEIIKARFSKAKRLQDLQEVMEKHAV